MLRFYFKLQALRLHRQVIELGVHPIISYMAVVIGFCLYSWLLFLKPYSQYIYVLLALLIVSTGSKPNHNTFLKLTYSIKDHYKIRLAENVISTLPFLIYLVFQEERLLGSILLILSLLMAFVSYKVRLFYAIPTPFSKHPFEFIVGFRLAFPVFLIAYFLTYISLRFSNYYIGIFALYIICVVCTFFYFKIENLLYVWIFSSSAKEFLFTKLKIAILSTLLLCLPILIAISFTAPSLIHVMLTVQIIGILLVCEGVLCKYSSIPKDIGMIDGLLVMFSIMFPPLLLIAIPMHYVRAIRQLEGILE